MLQMQRVCRCAKKFFLKQEDLLFLLPERFEVDQDADIDDLLPWNDGISDSFAML